MDGNSKVTLIVGASACALLGWLLRDYVEAKLVFDDTVRGAILGGFLAGVFGLLAAGYSIYADRVEKKRETDMQDLVLLRSIVIKLGDLHDLLLKNRLHFQDESGRSYFEASGEQKSFSRPLEFRANSIDFSIDERSFVLRKYGGELFTTLSNMRGLSQSFSFLHERHRDAFYLFKEETTSNKTAREGYQITSEVDLNSDRLLALMDIDGALRSMLEHSTDALQKFYMKILAIYNQSSDIAIRIEVFEGSPSASNDLRVEY